MRTVNDLCRDRFEGAPQLGRVLDGFRVRCAVDRALECGAILHVTDPTTGDAWTAGRGTLIRWSRAVPSGEPIDADPARELYESCGSVAIVEALIARGEIEATDEEIDRLARSARRRGRFAVPPI